MAELDFKLLDNAVEQLQENIANRMAKIAPVRTGKLRNSIKPLPVVQTPNGIKAPITYVPYGVFPDLGTKYQKAQRFTQRAEEEEFRIYQQELAEAAGRDVANYLDDVLPNNINITLQV